MFLCSLILIFTSNIFQCMYILYFSIFCIIFDLFHYYLYFHIPYTFNHIQLLSKLWRIPLLESNRLCCSIDLLWFKLSQFIKICPLLACVGGPGGDFHMFPSSFSFSCVSLFIFFNILKTFYDCQRHCGKFKRLRLQLF